MAEFRFVDKKDVPVGKTATRILFPQLKKITADNSLTFDFVKMGITYGGVQHILRTWNSKHPEKQLKSIKKGNTTWIVLK